MPEDAAPTTRRARLWERAEERHIPLLAILTTVAVVVSVYLAGKLVYKLREVFLLIVVAGFIALLIVFAVPALESSVFLGFIFPGETALI